MAVDEDDGQVDRIMPIAGQEEVDGFEHIFFSTARRNLTDEHLWISVLSRPTKSHFTRAQRLTCCLTLLFSTMLANAMWYKTEGETSGDQVIRAGPIILSVQALLTSIFANLTVIPINLIIVQLFRKSKPRYYLEMEKTERAALQKGAKAYLKQNKAALKREPPKDGQVGDESDHVKEKKKKKGQKYLLPWWCSYIAWVLAFLVVLISASFVLFYTLFWGKDKAEEWLGALLLSFAQSVIVVQPLKVIHPPCVLFFDKSKILMYSLCDTGYV